MKYGTQARLFGIYQTVLFSAVSTQLAYGTIFSDGPVALRIGKGVLTGLCAFGVADGTVDIVRGTHHYLLANMEKGFAKLTKNRRRADEIGAEINHMLSYRNQEHPFFGRRNKN